MAMDFTRFKAVAKVYETKNYSLFVAMDFNRDVTESRVEKLVASFSEKEILNPIVVNEKMEIVDGQGRYEALKRLGRPIRFVVARGSDINDCRRMNRYNTHWSIEDFVRSYAAAGNQNYIELMNCRENLGVSYSNILRFVNQGNYKERGNSKILSGKLLFTSRDYETVADVVQKAQDIRNALLAKERPNEAFYTAVKVAIETKGYNHDRMVKCCEKARHTYSQMSNLESQLKEFSRIYNARYSADNRIYFEEYMRNRGYNVRDYKNEFAGNNSESAKTLRDGSKQ